MSDSRTTQFRKNCVPCNAATTFYPRSDENRLSADLHFLSGALTHLHIDRHAEIVVETAFPGATDRRRESGMARNRDSDEFRSTDQIVGRIEGYPSGGALRGKSKAGVPRCSTENVHSTFNSSAGLCGRTTAMEFE